MSTKTNLQILSFQTGVSEILKATEIILKCTFFAARCLGSCCISNTWCRRQTACSGWWEKSGSALQRAQTLGCGLPWVVCTREAVDTYSKTDGSAPSVATQRPCCRDEPLKHHSWASCMPSLSDWSQLWHRSICNVNRGFMLWIERLKSFPGRVCFRRAVTVKIFPVILVDELIPSHRPFPGASNHVKFIASLRWQS